MNNAILLPILQIFGLFLATGSVLLAWRALKATHDWNRRSYALKIIEDWNTKTSEHRKAIEQAFPGLVDTNKRSSAAVELSKQVVQSIYASKPSDEQEWKLRFHLIQLGNHFEYIATAYLQHVADQAIIDQAFRATMIRWHGIMLNFIAEIEEHRGYRAWAPWEECVNKWKLRTKSQRQPTA